MRKCWGHDERRSRDSGPLWVALTLLVACAGAAPRQTACTAPAERAEVAQIQVGWNAVPPGGPDRPPVIDERHPPRYEKEAEKLAQDLFVRCKKGEALAPLQQRYSEADPGTQVIDSGSDSPLREAALCLRPGECTVFHGPAAYHVVKRLN